MFEKISFKNYFKVSAIVLALVFAFLLEYYMVLIENYIPLSVHENIIPFIKASLPLISKFWLLIFFILFFIIFTILLNPKLKEKVGFFIYTYRFHIAILAFIISVICQIHESSINQLDISGYGHKSLLGVSRAVRSDEFNVNTPFALSQYFNNFGYFSDIVRGVPTDMFLSFGQPVLDIAVIFRPFHWGYLLLSQGYGLSFYWMGRLIALFIISFEFGMLITNNNKKLALAYTILLTFSPLVQWWFAVNMLVEMLVFGQVFILLTNYYMKTDDFIKKAIITFVLIICAGGFILTMYPAWEIPFAYVFLALFLWVVYKNYNEFTISKKDILLFIVFFVILISGMLYVFFKSQATILAVINTAYPGARFYWGGLISSSFDNPLFIYPKTIFAPLVLNILYIEICSTALISFFPLSIVLLAIISFVQKKKDLLLYILLLINILFTIYYIFPFPYEVGKITLLGNTVAIRFISVIFFIDLLMLIRGMSLVKLDVKKHYKVICAVVAFVISLIFTVGSFGLEFESQRYLIQAIISFILFGFGFLFVLLSCFDKKYLKGFLVTIIVISFLTGAMINPIDSGVDYYYNQPIIQETGKVVSQNPNANWIVVSPILIDEIIPVGAHTINSVNIYPNMELWSKLDPTGQHNETYNRFAHITVSLQNGCETTFNNSQMDVIEVNLSVNDLKQLNITYILINSDLENLSNDNVTFIEIYQDNVGNRIYEVK